MKTNHQIIPLFTAQWWKIAWLPLLFCTLLTVSCGKKDSFQKNQLEDVPLTTEAFAEQFLTENNFPYQQLRSNEMQNSTDEYLFYIPNGAVYRTVGDYTVVIVARSEIREPEEKRGTAYSGELYQIFEDDDIDLLKYCAAGQYALMAVPSTIPDWEENELVEAFMTFSAKQTK